MKFGIICAGDFELEPFLPTINNMKISEKALLKFYLGNILNIPVVALYSGVCKVNAAIATQILIDTYQVEAIISAGTAGGIDKSINLFDTIISTQAAYHDVDDDILTDFHPWMKDVYFNADDDLLQAAHQIAKNNSKIHFGRMVTGESFIRDKMREGINKKFSPLSVDMETAAIAHVCYANKIPFIAIRTITDTADHSGLEYFDKNCKQASIIAKDVVLNFLAYIGTAAK